MFCKSDARQRRTLTFYLNLIQQKSILQIVTNDIKIT